MVFKCKMCDASLNINAGDSVAVCEYCGSTQTLPKFNDERIGNLYDRAEHYRKNNEYDKALALYEEMLKENLEDAEIYWSVILCKYGVEYVEEGGSNKRVPTVNRTQVTSIFDDENYREALKYADAEQKKVYEEEAKVINEIQKEILAISQKEEPFDIFICYKETDELGKRTLDSVLAAELYNLLNEEGYKVFFARVTLNDKFGVAYEPYIFAALQSSKVMLVVGTSSEHFEAAWVKNEWSRYLALIKNGKEKYLIPAYKGMSPYDLPEEFSHLQAINMGEVGFQQDLLHGIRKILSASNITSSEQADVSVNIKGLLERGFLFIEEKDWKRADECMENVLNQNPENAEAYLGKLLISLKLADKEELYQCEELFEHDDNYRKIMRFGDEEIKAFVKGAMEGAKDVASERIYREAVKTLENAIDPQVISNCIPVFTKLGDYKDSKQRIEECKVKSRRAEEKQLEDKYIFYMQLIDSKEETKIQHALKFFNEHVGYKDSEELAKQCRGKLLNLEKERTKAVRSARIDSDMRGIGENADMSSVVLKIILVPAILVIAVILYIASVLVS